MPRKLTIYFICGAGLGSSLACQMVAQDVLTKRGLDEKLEHEAISSTPGLKTDIIVSAENFKTQFEKYDLNSQIRFVFLHNIVDPKEIEDKLIPVIKELGSQPLKH
jgi:PTS system ascorbate-specific IIB component